MKSCLLFIEQPGKKAAAWIIAVWVITLTLIAGLFCTGILWGSVSTTLGGWKTVWLYRDVFWRGWLLTIILSTLSLAMSSLIGLAAALARRSRILPLRSVALLYVEGIRGTPLLVQILVLYYVVANGIGLENRLVAGVIILSVFSGAYLAEMIRAGIEAIPASQIESARAIGFTTFQSYRFVIAPQALRHLLPSLAGQFASLIKDSSLLSIIGIGEFTLAAQQVNSATYRTLESYLPLAIGYLALTLPVSLVSKWLENRLHYET